MRRALPFLLPLLALCLACEESPSALGGEYVGAILHSYRQEADIRVVPEGDRVSVTVVTYGNGCWAQGRTEVTETGSTVEITPWDERSDWSACDDILLQFPHQVHVAPPGARPWTLIVHGLPMEGGDPVSFTRIVQ